MGYAFNDPLSIEAGYADFVDTNKDFEHLYSNAWLTSAKSFLQSQSLIFMAALVSVTLESNPGDSNDVYYGVGAGVKIGPARVAL
ncbi:hypothetical protein OK016_13335 [Vibrio chagasii]|nr:hypothetical protein [Vibrio chagasii]